MAADARSISFVMNGSKNIDLLLLVEESPDGTLHFSYEVDGKAELRGLFFDFKKEALIDNLVVDGSTVTNQQVGNEAVSNLNDGNNMKGTKEDFDVGMTFGTSGKGKDLTTTGEFVLSSSDGSALTLDDVANVTFGARFSSSGLKLVAISPAAPDAIDDTIVTDEDSATNENAPNANLISNDTDADGDQLTIVAINGDSSQVGDQFTLSTGALISIESDGSFDLDPNGAYEDLAVGETREDSFTYRITDELVDPSNQGFDTATANIIIEGRNDAPIISLAAGDSASELVVETDGNLTTGGTLTVHDVDLSDIVQASVHSVSSSDNDGDSATPDNATLHGMLSLNPESPAAILDGTEDTDSLSWTFDSASESFDYLATDEFLTLEYTVRALDDNGAHDDRVVTITVDGTNDAPEITLAGSDSDAETVNETNGNLATAGTLTVSDLDTTDIVDASVVSVSTGGVDSDASTPANSALYAMFTINPNAPAVLLDGTENVDTLNWAFNSGGQAFNYLADDEELILNYTVSADDDNGADDSRIVTVTVDGTNDRPIANDVSGAVGEDAASVQINFDASDVDSSDILSYQILAQPRDSLGRQYGQVVNNNDGSFSFRPLDNFQFLEAGESRQVTFDYVAIDDSGTATDTSVAKTATITVNGADDAPTAIDTRVVFETENQSMWETGPATIIDWREFYGVSWSESFSQTLVEKKNYTILGSVEIAGVEVFPGLSVSSPKLSVDGGMSGRVGVSPYFFFDSGSVDSTIPVDIDLTYEVQYEAGDRVSIATGYEVANSAEFTTSSPQVTFGLDLVFEFAANANFRIGSSTAGSARNISLFNVDVNVDEQESIAGVAGSGDGDNANLIEFSSVSGLSSDVIPTFPTGEDGNYDIPIFDDSNLRLSFPYIATTGSPTFDGSDRLTSTGSDDVAILTLDLDDLLSQSKYFPPMRFTGDRRYDFKFDLPEVVNDFLGIGDIDVNIYRAEWDFELIDVDLIGTLSAVQDFTLDIDKLPLILTLENGDTVSGFEMGDVIEFDLPDWDVDTLGDADGEMDYSINIDMDALFNNYTTLDFDLDLVVRALKANFFFDTIATPSVNLKLFGNADSNYFAYEEEFDLLDVSPLAELFGDEDPSVSQFSIIGWNTPSYENAFDIA